MVSASKEGRFQEFFGCATNCNIQSVSRIVIEDEVLEMTSIQETQTTPFANYLNDKLTQIMSGPSDHKWITPLE